MRLETSGDGKDYKFFAQTNFPALETVQFHFGIDGTGAGTAAFDNVNTIP